MASFPVTVRISRWFKVAATWKTVHEIPVDAIEELRTTFVGPKVEDQLKLIAFERGTYSRSGSTDKVMSDAADVLAHGGALYRIDVFSPEESQPVEDRTNPVSGHVNMMTWWSGIVQRIRVMRNLDRFGFEVQATGWTSWLDRIVVTDRYYYNKTIEFIVDDIFNLSSVGVAALWPGSIDQLKDARGSAASLTLERIGWKRATFRSVLDELGQFGNFIYGVSVHGWPYNDDATTSEFSFIAPHEPRWDRDPAKPAPGAQGFGHGVGTMIDADDPNVIEFMTEDDGSRYATRWEFLGEPLFADIISVVTGHDSNEIRDTFSKTNSASGAFFWEPGGFVGWEIALVDQAQRRRFRDSETGEIFDAGRIEPLTAVIAASDGSTTFPIDSYTESGGADGESIYGSENFPAPSNNLSLTITTSAIRYVLRPASARVVRVVQDESLDDSAAPFNSEARERISRIVQDPFIRGYLQAGLFAIQERFQERFASQRARLRVNRWRRFITGNGAILDDAIHVSTGEARMTLLGTTANGGDNFGKGDDTRPVGLGRMYTVRRADAKLLDDGWEVSFELSGTPRDFVTTVLPQAIRSRTARRN